MTDITPPWDVLLEHLPRNGALVRGILGVGVMTTGSGPCDEGEFDECLKACGVWVAAPSDSGPNVLIVGHEDWSEENLDEVIEGRAGGTLRVYSQELVFASLALGADAFDVLTSDELLDFGEGHPALEYLMAPIGFDWPTTDVPERTRGLAVPFSTFESPETGLLGHMGYHVGKTSDLTQAERREILDEVIAAALRAASPPDEYYLGQWGDPRTPDRLRKTANCIASFVRLRKLDTTKDNSVAIGDWEEDLRYLKSQYYGSLGSRFVWPDTSVK